MAIFNSYVKLPEGILQYFTTNPLVFIAIGMVSMVFITI